MYFKFYAIIIVSAAVLVPTYTKKEGLECHHLWSFTRSFNFFKTPLILNSRLFRNERKTEIAHLKYTGLQCGR